jgi:sarcosine oxidase subunit alpha
MSAGRMPQRLGRQPGEVVDRSRVVSFTWNGKPRLAYPGDTITSALAAAGERVFSRSFKYHRPRGVLTAGPLDPGCLVTVDDEPNVAASQRRVTDGMTVAAQNAWPSLGFDVKSVNRLAGPALSAGFYYKTFMKPRALWPAYEAVIKRFSAGGPAPETPFGSDASDHRYAHPDVLVAGAGPAGMTAACAAAEAGASVMLVEDEPELGGHLRYGGSAELEALASLRRRVAATPGLEVITEATVLGRYDDNWLAVAQRRADGERLIRARTGAVVAAPGLIERPYVFAGNDLPGVMLSTAVRRLINLYAVRPGKRAVVLSANGSGDAAAEDLDRAGVEVARVEDVRVGGDVVRARGGRRVRQVVCGDGVGIDCDLLVTATGWTAPTALMNMAGDRPAYDPAAARFFPEPVMAETGDAPGAVLATGGLAGDGSVEQLCTHAEAVGAEAARRGRRAMARLRARTPHAASDGDSGAAKPGELGGQLPSLGRASHPECFGGHTDGIVDYSEDVSVGDLESAVAEGYDSAELAKRYTTVTMGPTQGKLEVVNAVALIARATGSTIAEVGTTVWRPPQAAVSLGALAGPNHQPRRVSALQPWHERHGAVPMVAGRWVRPDHYGDPQAEVAAVRSRVGVIDVSPLGKLDLRGPDVPALLNQVYVNKWSKLPVGRVRYGAMCTEDGVVFDDGVTGRLGDEHYLMTTTSSGADGVHEWLERWVQTQHPEWRVQSTPVGSAYASMNVAGPRSRQLMGRVVEGVDLDPEAFGYMQLRTGRVAGVDGCLVWRIGFTGELSYELHVPACYGLHVWQALMSAGADLGVTPFGVEAQRVLRLEAGHLIVGQDTDPLTKGYSAGLDWAIKLDKDDFAGRPELAWQRGRDGASRLVALQPDEPDVVPAEGSQLVEEAAAESGARIVGRITSARMSPTLGRGVCLGLVAPHLAEAGAEVGVVVPGCGRETARVMEHLAHFDPEGVRVRG